MKKSNVSLQYVGSFSTLQNEGSKKVMNYGDTVYSERQNELYNRLLLGVNYYTKEELYAMNSTKKNRIVKAHTKAQHLLNIWKQELTIKATNSFFKTFFPESELTQVLLENSVASTKFVNTLSFKDLGIRKRDIVDKFIEAQLLPYNFKTL